MTFNVRSSFVASAGPQRSQPSFLGLTYWSRCRPLVVLASRVLCGVLLLAAGQLSIAVEPPGQVVSLTPQQQKLRDDARSILARSPLSAAERQLRLNAIDAVLSGTVAVPDDDNPEARNPSLWTESSAGYVVAANHTVAEAISDLWIVHDNDGVPIPRIWCYKYSSLIMARAYVKYFQDTGNDAGLSAINRLIGHRIFPNDLTKQELALLWMCRAGSDNLLPGDEVWFENPYFDRGSQLIRRTAYQRAIRAGKSADEATKIAAQAVESLAIGEEGSLMSFIWATICLRRGADRSSARFVASPVKQTAAAATPTTRFTLARCSLCRSTSST